MTVITSVAKNKPHLVQNNMVEKTKEYISHRKWEKTKEAYKIGKKETD